MLVYMQPYSARNVKILYLYERTSKNCSVQWFSYNISLILYTNLVQNRISLATIVGGV